LKNKGFALEMEFEGTARESLEIKALETFESTTKWISTLLALIRILHQ
jgi:hypothetical protein